MDLHAGQIQGFFTIPVDHMTAMPMLTQWFTDQYEASDLVVVSPDAGRAKAWIMVPQTGPTIYEFTMRYEGGGEDGHGGAGIHILADAKTGATEFTLDVGPGAIAAIEYSPDGRWLAFSMLVRAALGVGSGLDPLLFWKKYLQFQKTGGSGRWH